MNDDLLRSFTDSGGFCSSVTVAGQTFGIGIRSDDDRVDSFLAEVSSDV